MTQAQIKNYAAFVNNTDIGYDEVAKDRFKRESLAILRQIAKLMGLQKGSYEIRFNPGGIAVSGDPILQSDPIDGRGGIYVNLSQGSWTSNFYFRSCKSRKDRTGGKNRWLPFTHLDDLQAVAKELKQAALENV